MQRCYLFRGSKSAPEGAAPGQRFHWHAPDRAMPCSWPPATVARVSETGPPAHYEITVQGILEPCWSAWFDGLQLTSDPAGRTIISGAVADQAALHGLLTRIRDLGLPLLAVRCTDQWLSAARSAAGRPVRPRRRPAPGRIRRACAGCC